MIALCARSQNNVIGLDGKLPWKCKGDLAFFKRITEGKTVVVGRKTFDGLPPLPGREILVVSTTKVGGNHILPEDFIKMLDGDSERFVLCGGAATYKWFVRFCGVFYLTTIKTRCEGDTAFDNRWMDDFDLHDVVEETDEYMIEKYVRKINYGEPTGKRYKIGE